MLRVSVVGSLELEVDGGRIQPPAGRPARALLGWLSLHAGPHPRGAVAAALWPDVRDESARASLRTALSAVREALGDQARAALIADRQSVELAGPPAAWVDVREFDELIEAGRAADAVALAGGELLPELDADWVLRARDRHRHRVGEAMAALAAAASAAGDATGALSWLRRRTELDPFDEQAHCELITAMDGAGDRAGAIAVYDRLSTRLRRELAIAPSARTRSVAAALRAGDGARSGQATGREDCALPLPAWLAPARWRQRFVGRAEPLARLHRAWDGTRDGAFGFSVVTGEPGIGKTRLVAQFAAELQSLGATVLAGAAEEDSPEPYQPIGEALAAVFGPDDLAPRTSNIVDGAGARARLHERLARLLERAAEGRPLLFVLDDLHWADPDTLTFLRRLTRRGLAVPTLVLATVRLGELRAAGPVGRTLGAIGREAPVARIEIGGLTLSDSASLVADRAHDHSLAQTDIEGLVDRTGGNPFFLEALVDAGLTQRGVVLPAGIAELVASRLQALDPKVAQVLEAGAVLGREFDARLAWRTAGLCSDEALEALDRASEAHLVATVPDRPGRMEFVHALVQEALTSRLAPGRLAALHASAVAALAPRLDSGSDDVLAMAARHALVALPALGADRVAELSERAGLALIAAQAPADAAELLARAGTACERAGISHELQIRLQLAFGDALRASGRGDEAVQVFGSARSLARRGHHGELLARAALGAVGPAVTIVAVDGETVLALEEGLDAAPAHAAGLRARIQARLATELAYDTDARRRDRLSAEALAAARELDDPRTLAAALGARHVVLWGPDHTRARLPLADEMLELARRAEDPALELQARTWRIVDLEELGGGAAVDTELELFAATASATAQTAYAWYVPAWRAARAYQAGRRDAARELQRQAARLGERAGDFNVQFASRVQYIADLADDRLESIDLEWQAERVRNSPAGWAYRSLYTWALAAVGRERDARRELAAQRAAGVPGTWPRDTNWLSAAKELSEAAWLLRDRATGEELEQLLLPFSDRIVVSARALMCMGSVAGALGRLAELRDDLDAAVERYAQAVEREQRAGASIWATHHRWRLGEVLAASGQPEPARALLRRVAEEASGMGMTRTAGLARVRLSA
jgi:DNA-binding SARP family transcriptional activator